MNGTSTLLFMPTRDEIAERLRNYVRQVRQEKRLTQKDVAKRGGIPLSTIGSLESEARSSVPSVKSLEGIAKGLGISPLVLIRIAQGLPAELSGTDELLASLLANSPPAVKESFLELLMMPEEQRRAAEAALVALVTALKQQSH